MKRSSPAAIDSATSRMLLVVENPEHVLRQAVNSEPRRSRPSATSMAGSWAAIVDPFGHEWEIGRPLAPVATRLNRLAIRRAPGAGTPGATVIFRPSAVGAIGAAGVTVAPEHGP